jgi:anti-sigma factor RsiW
MHNLIHAYVDDELDLVRSTEIERHLAECGACAQVYQNHQALRSALRAGPLYFKAPPHLKQRILASVRQADRAERVPRRLPWAWAGIAASLALVAVAVWGIVHMWPVPPAEDRLAQAVVSGHVRSLVAGPLITQPSSDKHEIKPWFDDKVDFSPTVKELSKQGFILKGARLDYLDNKLVGTLVYRRNRHVINLFVWRSGGDAGAEPKTLTLQGYHVVHWTQADLTYWAVSDLNEGELRGFARLVQDPAVQ